jgi:hypothetical protein
MSGKKHLAMVVNWEQYYERRQEIVKDRILLGKKVLDGRLKGSKLCTVGVRILRVCEQHAALMIGSSVGHRI